MFAMPPKVQKLSSEIEGLVYKNEKSSSPMKAVIFHGYGANCQDLFPIAPFLNSAKISEWIFPDGLIGAPGVPGGRAWYPLDIAALERSLQEGNFREFSGPLPPELTAARKKIEKMLDDLRLKPENTLVGGFSQGAMLAADLYLNSPRPFKGLILLSGTWLGQQEWERLAQQRPGRFFQSHGEQDPLLPYSRAEELSAMFNKHGWTGAFHGFAGGHEIPPAVLKQLARFLDQL